MEFRVLGPVEALDDGTPLALGGPKSRALLAVLAMNANRVVAVEKLISALWDDPPGTVTSQVQQLVSQLRRALGARSGDERARDERARDDGRPRLEFRAPGYVLRARPDEVDLALFEARAAEGRAALDAGRTSEAAEILRSALGLWRGSALGGVAEPLARTERPRLDERRLAVVEDRITADLALGRHVELVAELKALVAEHPLRESLRAHLMLALYRAGRQADALEAYREGREILREELGLDPGAELRELEQAILRGDPALTLPSSSDVSAQPPPARSLPETPRSPRQLPFDVTDFTGREEEVRRIGALLRSSGSGSAVTICAITGQGGVGKTSLAVHCAHLVAAEFPDGQLYVDLQGHQSSPTDPAAVLERFLRALGVDGRGVPEDVAERAAMYRDLLADRRVLVVLDNAGSEAQVRPLLPASPYCAVLVTSRARLGALEVSHRIDLGLFDEQSAVDLLTRIIGPDRVAENLPAATRIARLCGHLPLALRIAAARLVARPHWSLSQLLTRLSDEHRRLDELVAGDLAVRTSTAMSYRGLDERAQRLFRLLGLLEVCDFASWVAAALLDTTIQEADDLVEVLVDARLLQPSRADENGRLRYRFHDLVRLYARELLDHEVSAGERQEALTRAAGAWLGLADRANARLPLGGLGTVRGPATRWPLPEAFVDELLVDARSWFDAECTALTEVIAHVAAADLDDLAWELAESCVNYLQFRSRFEAVVPTHQPALEACVRAGNTMGQAVMLRNLADYSGYVPGGRPAALRNARRSRELFRDLGYAYGEAGAAVLEGDLLQQDGNPAAARELLGEAISVAGRAGNPWAELRARDALTRAYLQQVRLPEALECARTFLTRATSVGRPGEEARAQQVLGFVLKKTGNHDESELAYRRALATMTELGISGGAVYILLNLGVLYVEMRHPAARATLEAALETANKVRLDYARGACLDTLAELDLDAGAPESALERERSALPLLRVHGTASNLVHALTMIGRACSALGRLGEARRAFDEARELCERMGDQPRLAELESLEAALLEGHSEADVIP